jgi:hypothetical protein
MTALIVDNFAGPLAVDICCGLGGWTEGLLAEGWRVRGYDIEAHEYGEERYPAELVIRNVLEMHGSEIADAELIVASPPCTEYSYMAMPWKRAKQIARALRGEDEFPEPYRGSRTVAELNAIFDACFRLQREASEAAGRHIPMIVENVRGAEPWVGKAFWNYGSFYLWGDIPALMPSARSIKNTGGSWFNIAHNTASGRGNNARDRLVDGLKLKDLDGYDRDHPEAFGWKKPRTSSGSKARRQATAQIAKIPLALSSHIARMYRPAPASAVA